MLHKGANSGAQEKIRINHYHSCQQHNMMEDYDMMKIYF